MRRTVRCLPILLLLVCSRNGSAAGPTLTVAVHDGTEATITDGKFAKEWRLSGSREGAPFEVSAAEELVSIRFSDKTPVARPKGSFVSFPTGERLSVEILQVEGEKLKVRSAVAGETEIPLSTIQGLVLAPESADALSDLARRAAEEQSDQVLLRNQDVVTGIVQEIDPTKVILLKGDEETPIARDLIAAIAFDPGLVDYKLGSEFFGQARLADGSLINLKGLTSDGSKLQCEATFGGSLVLEATEMIDVSFRNGRVLYLSDIDPTGQEAEAFLDGPHTFVKDRAVTGGPLRMAGQTYTKGLGVRSRSKLSYALSGFDRFEAVVGIDENAGAEASVRFLLEIDGKPAFDSGEMLAATPPKEIKLSVKDGKELSLIVDFESRGDVQDYADWANARLVR